MNAWKPGDVAVATVRGKHGVFVLRRGNEVDGSSRWASAVGWWLHADADLADARPLVVIDPEDREQVERFTHLFLSHHWGGEGQTHTDAGQAALREFANPTPPKPEEPTGLGAVVEDANGTLWIRVNSTDCLPRPWAAQSNVGGNMAGWLDYADINAVRVLSEGVTA